MWKLTFFVNCSGWKPDVVTGKRGYENAHYFKTEKAAREWVAERNKRLPNYPLDIVSLEWVTLSEFAKDVILPLYC